MTPAPPRNALEKYGGKLTLNEFYGKSNFVYKEIVCPPFVTFAMYAELTGKTNVNDKLTHGLRRPQERTHPEAKEEPTMKPPLILEFLARKGLVVKKPTDLPEPSKKKKLNQVSSSPFTPADEGGSSLARYIVRE
jgi:hypothetical protein